MEPVEILNDAITRHDPRYVIGLFSGGHDSLTATHIASQHLHFSFALHINTGIGIPETRHFVRETCAAWKIELREYEAARALNAKGEPDPQVYADLVQQYGFPGAPAHRWMYQFLKERPLRQAIRDLQLARGERVVLVSGIRAQESTRRMGHAETEHRDGSQVWVNPIIDFSAGDVADYIEAHGLHRNPVVDKIHKSGECLCGAFAKPGELDELRLWFPDVASEIDDLARRVRERGFPWGWDEEPPAWWSQVNAGQMFMPGMEPDEYDIHVQEYLCTSCKWRRKESTA